MATRGDTTAGEDRTLHVRYQEPSGTELADRLAAIERGEDVEPHFEIVYHDPDDVHRITRPKNLELLRAIVQYEPTSIRETARVVERDVRQVHRNLTELADLHLIELIDEGQSKRPHIWYDTIDIDLPLISPTLENEEQADA